MKVSTAHDRFRFANWTLRNSADGHVSSLGVLCPYKFLYFEGYFECYATMPMLIAVVFTVISVIAIIDHHVDSKRYFLL